MSTPTKRLSAEALAGLNSLVVNGHKAVIRDQLDRKVYTEVNALLEQLGGKWDRKRKAHIFPPGTDVVNTISTVIAAGEWVDEQQLYQFYQTPPAIADRMIRMAVEHFGGGAFTGRVLEPSAGRGAIVDSILNFAPRAHVTAIEIDPKKTQVLIDKYNKYRTFRIDVIQADFLRGPGAGEGFDAILMNPPFAMQQEAKHVLHATAMLKPGGVLVSVMSRAVQFRETAYYRDVRARAANIVDLPSGSFEGTDVETCLVTITK